CSRCGHTQDVMQKFSDAPLTVCPRCGEAAFAKQLTAPAFQLKGTGWYVTDFRDSGKAKAGAKGEAGGDGGESKASDGAKGEGGESEGGKSDGKAEGGESAKPAAARADAAGPAKSDASRSKSGTGDSTSGGATKATGT
ncbi:MAG TPA: FmdB family zinc ribbon protein, partial [Burkholderiaceae bacterium]|nr:FmdB family zinc ribbon protein [Burkholderiaceae bacterium]